MEDVEAGTTVASATDEGVFRCDEIATDADDGRRRRRRHLDLRLRPLRRPDLPAVRAAHVEMFPIDYEEAFYEAIVRETGGVFALGLFEEGEEEQKSWGGSLPRLFPSSSPPPRSKLIAFVTARAQSASDVDGTDALYLGLKEEAEAEAEETARRVEKQATTTAPAPPPAPPVPRGPGGDLLGPRPDRPRAFYILTLGVSPSHRGRGIAKSLVAAVVERAGSSSADVPPPPPFPPPLVYLHVATFNGAAVSLYESCGFSRLATFENFYSISTERRPDPGITSYHAHLFAMRVGSQRGEKAGAEGSPWPFPLPPPPPLVASAGPLLLRPKATTAMPPTAAALASLLFWLSSLPSRIASSLMGVAGASGGGNKGEIDDDEMEIPTTTTGATAAAAPSWLSRLFQRRS